MMARKERGKEGRKERKVEGKSGDKIQCQRVHPY